MQGVFAAIGAAILYGTLFALLGPLAKEMGALQSTFAIRIGGLVIVASFLIVIGGIKNRPAMPPPVLLRGAAIAALDTAALIAQSAGLAHGPRSVVSVLSSLFSAVTVALAFVLLGERPRARQWIGIAAILCGVSTLALVAH